MKLDSVERWVRIAGGAALLVPAFSILLGIGRGLRRPAGRVTGTGLWPLISGGYVGLFVIGIAYLALCARLWHPIPVRLSLLARLVALFSGSLLYFGGLGLLFWGRLALGEMYNVSSSLGVKLYAGHRLVTHGPFALVRHPMYLGGFLAGAGGLILYRTWTTLFYMAHSPIFLIRARNEEQALAEEFGPAWQAYRKQVPAWIPRLTFGRASGGSPRHSSRGHGGSCATRV